MTDIKNRDQLLAFLENCKKLTNSVPLGPWEPTNLDTDMANKSPHTVWPKQKDGQSAYFGKAVLQTDDTGDRDVSVVCLTPFDTVDGADGLKSNIADFIAFSRTAIPNLVAMVETLLPKEKGEKK
jgi:hypothetical protein